LAIRFERVEASRLPLLVEWLTRPHVRASGWDETLLEDIRRGDPAGFGPHIAYRGPDAIGYIQWYAPAGDAEWWPGERDPGARGIDLFLAEGSRLGEGLGTLVLREFAAFLFRDPAVTRIQADPEPGNARAIRALEKAGFRSAGAVTTPDGEALLMLLERAAETSRSRADRPLLVVRTEHERVRTERLERLQRRR
jgi:aminoglycoside 6'-N-acetyltransferase